jgi:hypothetical protein
MVLTQCENFALSLVTQMDRYVISSHTRISKCVWIIRTSPLCLLRCFCTRCCPTCSNRHNERFPLLVLTALYVTESTPSLGLDAQVTAPCKLCRIVFYFQPRQNDCVVHSSSSLCICPWIKLPEVQLSTDIYKASRHNSEARIYMSFYFHRCHPLCRYFRLQDGEL